MIGALWILLATVLFGAVLYLFHRHSEKNRADSGEEQAVVEPRPEGCCGQHIVCEKESLLTNPGEKIVYYEDEELDRYRGIAPEGYTDGQIDEFRDVLYTLKPYEISGWARSIQLRGIEFPAAIKDELIMLISESRTAAAGKSSNQVLTEQDKTK